MADSKPDMKTAELPTLRPTPLFNLSTRSASGLVRIGGSLYVISDDTLSLLEITQDGSGRSIPLLAGNLPEDEAERKSVKPDFESLFIFGDQLVGLGSGSTPGRGLGFSFSKDQLGSKVRDLPRSFSLEALYTLLRESIPDLNIEGAIQLGDEVLLCQRGNSKNSFSGMIRLQAEKFKEGLNSAVDPSALISIHRFSDELPTGYGFTDVALDPRNSNSVWFLAVREETTNTYDDGAFSGAVMGELKIPKSGSPTLGQLSLLEINMKPEGLWLEPSDEDGLTAFIVTDADSPATPSLLYGLELASTATN